MQKDVSSKMDENEYIKKYKDKDLYLAIRNREDTEGMNQDELDVKKYYDILQSKIQNKDKILMYFDINKKDIINEFVNCSHIHTFKEHYAIVSEDTVKHIDVTEIDLTKEDEGIRLNIIPINGGDNKGKLKYLFTSNKKTIINKVKGEDLLSIIEPDVSSDTSHNHNMQFFTVEGNEVIKDQFTTDSIPVEISYSIDYGILCLDYHSRNVKQKLYFYKDNGSDIIVSKMDLVLDTEFDLKDILTRWKRHITTVDNDIYQILADRLALIINQQELYGDHDKEMSVTTMKINGVVYHDIENVLMETGRLVVHEYNDESRDYFIRKLRT